MDPISFVVDIKLILILVGLDNKQFHIELSIKFILIMMISSGHLITQATSLCISLLSLHDLRVSV